MVGFIWVSFLGLRVGMGFVTFFVKLFSSARKRG